MHDPPGQVPADQALATLDQALSAGLLEPSAARNIRHWLTDPAYQDYAAQVVDHLRRERFSVLNDVFWTVIPFGTAGRRGRMYPIGTNAVNERTMGESAQGLADYLRAGNTGTHQLRCAVAYDTRHRSREFAELCAEVMAAAGFQVYFFDGHRGTPELAFAVRHFACAAGIMISASHNPPSDNAIKVFGASGGQLRPPDDTGVMRRVAEVSEVRRRPFAEAHMAADVRYCQSEVDGVFCTAVAGYAHAGPRQVRILYSPLHGVGVTSVLPVLAADRFHEVEIYEPHASPDGDFPNVPGHIANPENPAVFDALIAHAAQRGADLILASDPDADRIGCAAPRADGSWQTFSGNQIAALLADFILRRRAAEGTLDREHYLVTTLVTTRMLRRLAEHHGARAVDDVLTGFKWLGGVIDQLGAEKFLFAAEEAHGYLVGPYIRDKDAAGAAMLLAELAAECNSRRATLVDALEKLYVQVGYHAERSFSRTLSGAAGMSQMRASMDRLRTSPPSTLGGMKVVRVRDYLNNASIRPRLVPPGPPTADCDLVFFDLERVGYAAAVRPSGTEPKLKFYLFAFEPPAGGQTLTAQAGEVAGRLADLERDLLESAGLSR